jgi:hypothetical protein
MPCSPVMKKLALEVIAKLIRNVTPRGVGVQNLLILPDFRLRGNNYRRLLQLALFIIINNLPGYVYISG